MTSARRKVWATSDGDTSAKNARDGRGASPPQTVSLADAGIEVTDLSFDLAASGPTPMPGKIRAWLDAPGVD